jgi:site-specific DNA recombinase
MKIAAIYARVSGDRQQKEGTIASQLEALEAYAREHDYQVCPLHVFQEDGYSGAYVDRPSLNRLREAVARGEIETVLVFSPDRLARQFAYQYILVREFERAGCDVLFTSSGLKGAKALGETPEERMLIEMKGVFAEYERAQILERCRRGRLFRARSGRVLTAKAPYGYRYLPRNENCPGQLVINHEEAEVVRRIYDWLVDEQLSTYQINKRLNESGIRTRSGNQRWAAGTIRGILHNPVYAGTFYYNKRRRVEAARKNLSKNQSRSSGPTSQVRRPKEEWIPISVPAIITQDRWDQAMEQLQMNLERAPRNNKKNEYLLRGLLVCSECQLRMCGRTDRYGTRRYQCHQKDAIRVNPDPCPNPAVQAERIEELVWQSINQLLRDPRSLAEQYQLREQALEQTPAQLEQQRLTRKIQALKGEDQRLIDAYQAGILDLNNFKERRERIADEISRQESHQAAIKQQLEQQQERQSLICSLEEFARIISSSLDNPSFETKQKILRLVVGRIEFKKNEIGIKYLIPISKARLWRRHSIDYLPKKLMIKTIEHSSDPLDFARWDQRSGAIIFIQFWEI